MTQNLKTFTQSGLYSLANPWPKRQCPLTGPHPACPRRRRRTWLRWRKPLSRHQKQQQQHWDTHLDKAPSCWVRFRKKGTVSPTAQERGNQKCLLFLLGDLCPWRSITAILMGTGVLLFCVCYCYY